PRRMRAERREYCCQYGSYHHFLVCRGAPPPRPTTASLGASQARLAAPYRNVFLLSARSHHSPLLVRPTPTTCHRLARCISGSLGGAYSQRLRTWCGVPSVESRIPSLESRRLPQS